jgi:hypothetical protein
MHDPDTVYASFDNHKQGDFKPYILKSTDRGRTWEPIMGDLPERQVCYTLAEDHADPNLLFIATEFGVFVTRNGGENWHQLKSGVPTIAVRDIEIQRRENDLVLGTFGRGFYVLDDYSPLRVVDERLLGKDAAIFPIKAALRYIEKSRLGGRSGKGSQGASFYAASNPPYGAVFTYYLKEKLYTRKELRRKAEKEAREAGKEVRIPTIEELRAEDEEIEPSILLIVRDESGEVIRRIEGSRKKGVHRVAWDLRYPSTNPVRLGSEGDLPPWRRRAAGPLALPGTYTVTLAKQVDGVVTELTEPEPFDVISLDLATFEADDRGAVLAFRRKVARLNRAVRGAVRVVDEAEDRIAHLRRAFVDTLDADPELLTEVDALGDRVNRLKTKLTGDRTRGKREEPRPPSIQGRVRDVVQNQWQTTSAPTQTQRDAYRYAGEEFTAVLANLRELMQTDLPALEARFEEAGAPWTPGRLPAWEME